ncbi:MAG: 50S ribosomal protein L24 [Parcubacteria group bacterium]|nr:50S ribosomal protein L24 [Parcubacteria group bacterium]
MKIRRNDSVRVIKGKDRGTIAKVLSVMPRDEHILVDGVNTRKRHRRPRRSGEKGQIIDVISPIPASNVMVVCPRCGRATRIGQRMDGGQKVRVCKKCLQSLP